MYNVTIESLFEGMKLAIDKACIEKNAALVFTSALSHGFSESDTTTQFTYSKTFTYTINEFNIVLNFRSIDPSGPFQNLSDIERFDLTLSSNDQVIKNYRNEYD